MRERMARPLVTMLAGVLLVLTGLPAAGTVLVPAELSELSRSAALVVRGKVVSTSTRWADGRRRVETIVTVSVEEALKGDVAGTVSFKVPGGDIGRYRSVMVGAPTFRAGEEVVLFLGARPPAMPYLLGLGQGVYRLQRDARSGRASVVSPALFAGQNGTVKVRRGDLRRRQMSFDEFADAVREAVADGARGGRRVPPVKGVERRGR